MGGGAGADAPMDAVEAEIRRFRRDRTLTRVLGYALWGVSLGFFGWLIAVIMVQKRLDVACLSLQGLAIYSGATRVVLSYWDQVPALVYGLTDPVRRGACLEAWARLDGAPGSRLWELKPESKRGDGLTPAEAVALLEASGRTPWRRVAPIWFGVYVVVVAAVVTWFLGYEPGPDF